MTVLRDGMPLSEFASMIGITMEDRPVSEEKKPRIYSSMTELAKAAVSGELSGLKVFIATLGGEEKYVPAKGPSGAHSTFLKGIAEQVTIRACSDQDLYQAIADMASEPEP